MKIIPQHSLVICDTFVDTKDFSPHEIIDPSTVKTMLVGENSRKGMEEVVNSEIIHLVSVKLRLGERAVVIAEDETIRNTLVALGRSVGAPVFTIGESDSLTPLAEHVDLRHIGFSPVLRPDLRSRYDGITFIGDVHGMAESFRSAISWARARNNFIVLLGDLLDYGPDSLDVVDEAYRLVMRHEAITLMGNHERKILRWADGHKVNLSEGNKVTTAALSALGDTSRQKWLGRFRALCQHSPLIWNFENVYAAHAAVHPTYWTNGLTPRVEDFAMFGEVTTVDKQTVRSYRWVESIPVGKTVIVGHEKKDNQPVVLKSQQDCEAVFLDTGSGKGGNLASADFRFDDQGLKLMNFNIH